MWGVSAWSPTWSPLALTGQLSRPVKAGRLSFSGHVHEGADHLRGDLRDDRIASGAQLSHSAGNPISQRLNAGFSWPGFVVSAGDPLGV